MTNRYINISEGENKLVLDDYIIEAKNFTKHYGAVAALDDVDFELKDGEILGLVGDNGAGKSTLIKMLSGAVLPTSGTIKIFGEVVDIKDPMDAFKVGIETIYQDLALFEKFDFTRNIFAGREYIGGGIKRLFRIVDEKKMRKEAFERVKDISVNIPSLYQRVQTFSGGQRQAVAIAKTLFWSKKIIIMDEPTAALGVQESLRILKLIKETIEHVRGIIIISHNIEHIIEVVDRVIVLRHGKRVGDAEVKDYKGRLDELYSRIVNLITGSEIISLRYRQKNDEKLPKA